MITESKKEKKQEGKTRERKDLERKLIRIQEKYRTKYIYIQEAEYCKQNQKKERQEEMQRKEKKKRKKNKETKSK